METKSFVDLLKSLRPSNAEERSRIGSLVKIAQRIQQRGWEASVAEIATPPKTDSRFAAPVSDLLQFFQSVSQDSLRYFHGLVEALEVYRSIHGRDLAMSSAEALNEADIHELRQIRNMCLENAEAISIY